MSNKYYQEKEPKRATRYIIDNTTYIICINIENCTIEKVNTTLLEYKMRVKNKYNTEILPTTSFVVCNELKKLDIIIHGK
jgi:hypothetical protein